MTRHMSRLQTDSIMTPRSVFLCRWKSKSIVYQLGLCIIVEGLSCWQSLDFVSGSADSTTQNTPIKQLFLNIFQFVNNKRDCMVYIIAVFIHQSIVHTQCCGRRRELHGSFGKPSEKYLAEQLHLRLVSADTKIAFLEDVVCKRYQQADCLRNACCRCRAHNAHFQRENKQPVEE